MSRKLSAAGASEILTESCQSLKSHREKNVKRIKKKKTPWPSMSSKSCILDNHCNHKPSWQFVWNFLVFSSHKELKSIVIKRSLVSVSSFRLNVPNFAGNCSKESV